MKVARVRAVIPMKGGRHAKSRLACVLDIEERTLLSETMAEHVLSVVLGSPAVANVVVVTGCANMASLSVRLGAEVVIDDVNTGTGPACLQVLPHLQAGSKVLFLSGDLPFLTGTAVERMIELSSRVVIAPDTRSVGTNALLLEVGCGVLPAFGFQSFQRHIAACKTTGIAPAIFEDPAAAFDVDEPADLATLGLWRGRTWFDVQADSGERLQCVGN